MEDWQDEHFSADLIEVVSGICNLCGLFPAPAWLLRSLGLGLPAFLFVSSVLVERRTRR